jgi:NADH-quinone oxidoreductase subunit N
VLVYLAIYVVMTIGAFAAVLMLRDRDGEQLETFSDIAGLSTVRPVVAWGVLLLMFSLAGIPPLFGFWGKFVVFQAAVQADMIVLAAIGIAASVIGAFYYLKFVKVMFFDEPAGEAEKQSPAGHWAVLGICMVIVSPLGYLLTPWLGAVADRAAAALFIVV